MEENKQVASITQHRQDIVVSISCFSNPREHPYLELGLNWMAKYLNIEKNCTTIKSVDSPCDGILKLSRNNYTKQPISWYELAKNQAILQNYKTSGWNKDQLIH